MGEIIMKTAVKTRQIDLADLNPTIQHSKNSCPPANLDDFYAINYSCEGLKTRRKKPLDRMNRIDSGLRVFVVK
jgi:hypothetical protein